jgi:hypothetical protein
VLVVVYTLWIGAVVAAVFKLLLLKFGSPHKRAASWLFACLIGSFGALAGLFVVRLFGIAEGRGLETFVGVGSSAAAVVILYAAITRGLERSAVRKGRPVRRTMLF